MKPVLIRENIYWVGAIDWTLRSFHGYTTNRGATYNAYLIVDEKVALIDTVKAPFTRELLERVQEVMPLDRIDYIISNHVEMDHSGALPEVVKACPNAKVITSFPNGKKGLTAHYGDLGYEAVKAGDCLSLGRRSLQFVPTPMLHWPDNMVTYCPEEKILFSNDAFGQHYASSGRFDDQEDLAKVLQEAKKYYANIVMPYSRQAAGAVKTVRELPLELIAPSHGVIWRSHISDILAAYECWSGPAPSNGALVIYDSMWHSTEAMARTIAEAFTEAGQPTQLIDLKETHISDVMTEVLTARYLAVGSPTLNNNMLPTVASFLCYLNGLTPKERYAFAFGSYGWGGQSVGQVEEALKNCGYTIVLPKQAIQYIPKKEQLDALAEAVRAIHE